MPATTAIDIGTYSFKAITGKSGKNPQIDKVVEASNPEDFSYPRDEGQAQKLLQAIDSFVHDHRLLNSDIRLSLPEEAVSTQVIEMPPLSDAELASAIDWQAEQHIPIPLEQLALEYQILYRPPKKVKDQPMKVLLTGTRKNIVELYTDLFLNLGVMPSILETQMFSVLRSLGIDAQDPTTLVAHIGASSTQISVVSQAQLQLVTNQQGGGNLITKALQQNIGGLDQNQAEQYKRSYGLDTTQFEGKIRQAIQPTVDTIIQEIARTQRYYNTQHPQDQVTQIVLSGGSARLPGLAQYITDQTNAQVLIASPFASAQQEGIATNEINPQAMTVCMGLMMR